MSSKKKTAATGRPGAKNTGLAGTDGADLLVSKGSGEAIDGGAGLDTLAFYASTTKNGVVVDLKAGTFVDANGNKGTIRNVEIVRGTEAADRITGSDLTDYLIGGGGDDRLEGGNGHDELYGMTGNDRLDGGDGHDYLVGGAGNDDINGGHGFDTADYSDDGGRQGIVVDLKTNKIVDGFGNTDKVNSVERVVGTAFADAMAGSNGDDTLAGGGGNDKLFGDKGADTLDGGAGNDSLEGGDGNDFLTGGQGNDMLFGGADIDAADYRTDGGSKGIVADLATGLVTDTFGTVDTLRDIEIVKGSVFTDRITGSDRTDYLDGWAGDDFLFGGKGADELYGALGNDRLEGGADSDYLDGGLGNDVLVGGERWDFFVGRMNEGHDVIADFDSVDLIDLRNTAFRSLADVASLLSYVTTAEGSGLRLQLGTGSMLVLNVKALDAGDFLFAV